jgi:hypothetical protein
MSIIGFDLGLRPLAGDWSAGIFRCLPARPDRHFRQIWWSSRGFILVAQKFFWLCNCA